MPKGCLGGSDMSEHLFSELALQVPPILTRRDVAQYFGNLISPRYLANLDSLGQGPKKHYIGRKAVSYTHLTLPTICSV